MNKTSLRKFFNKVPSKISTVLITDETTGEFKIAQGFNFLSVFLNPCDITEADVLELGFKENDSSFIELDKECEYKAAKNELYFKEGNFSLQLLTELPLIDYFEE